LLQLPAVLLEKIVGELPVPEKAQFRLACSSWRNACPAHALAHRLTIAHRPGWELHAAAVRHYCPNIQIVVHLEGCNDVAQLLQHPHCDVVSCFPQGAAAFPQWALHPGIFQHDTYAGALQQAQQLADILEKAGATTKGCLELHLKLRSNSVIRGDLNAELQRLKPVIVQVREQEQLLLSAGKLFPITSPMLNLRVLAFCLPRKPNSASYFQNAVRGAPNLECLQIYAHSSITAERIIKFLQFLPDLAKLVSLRVDTARHHVCLPAECLKHITMLELGSHVHFIGRPNSLHRLVLENLDKENQGYIAMLSAIADCEPPFSIELSKFSVPLLPSLPVQLYQLSLLQKLDVGLLNSFEDTCALHLGLGQLTSLRALYIADCLTSHIMGLLVGKVFLHVHTFGISFTCHEHDEYKGYEDKSGNIIIKSTQKLMPLIQAFPNIQRLQVSCRDTEARVVILDSFWINKVLFPQLSVVIFSCPWITLELMNMTDDPSIHRVFRD